jgi:hypothetical protein
MTASSRKLSIVHLLLGPYCASPFRSFPTITTAPPPPNALHIVRSMYGIMKSPEDGNSKVEKHRELHESQSRETGIKNDCAGEGQLKFTRQTAFSERVTDIVNHQCYSPV